MTRLTRSEDLRREEAMQTRDFHREEIDRLKARVEEMEKELDAARFKMREVQDDCDKETWDRTMFLERAKNAEAERDSLRAKLERAMGALKDAIGEYEDNSHYKSEYLQEKHGDVDNIARMRAVLADLSADAPAQQTPIPHPEAETTEDSGLIGLA